MEIVLEKKMKQAGETIRPASQSGPRPARAKIWTAALSLSPPADTWDPLPCQHHHQSPAEEARTEESHERVRFQFPCISSRFDSRRFKAPIEAPFLPTNSPLDPLHFPPNHTEREPPGCSQSTSPSRGNSRSSSTTTVDSGVPSTSNLFHLLPLDLAHIHDIFVYFIAPQVELFVVDRILPSTRGATPSCAGC